MFAGRLSIPYLTDAGPVNITFRCMEQHECKHHGHSKYMFMKGSKTNMYGVQSIDWADDWIVVTEGEIDALTWQQIGVPALGISGAEKWQACWSHILEDFSRIYFIEDGDDAGEKLYERISHEVDNVIRVRMPDGEDSNSMFLKSGKDYLLGRIKK